MDMSEHWNPPTGPNEPTEGTPAPAGGGAGVPATHDSGSIYGGAIPLPPANSNLGAPYPPEGMQSQLPPTGATPAGGPRRRRRSGSGRHLPGPGGYPELRRPPRSVTDGRVRPEVPFHPMGDGPHRGY